jgi:hypothetical protein
VQLVDQLGVKKWSQIAKMLNGRVGKQCRERWHNHLRPDIRVFPLSSSSPILSSIYNIYTYIYTYINTYKNTAFYSIVFYSYANYTHICIHIHFMHF